MAKTKKDDKTKDAIVKDAVVKETAAKDTVAAKAKEIKDTAVEKITEAAEKVTEAAETAVKKTTAKAKTAAAKIPKAPKATGVKESCFIEFDGKQIAVNDIMAKAKELYNGEIKTLSVYVKPEDSKVYYVINDVEHSDFDI